VGQPSMKIFRAISLYFVAALFLYAGIDKAFHYGGFVNALGGYVLVPEGLERFLAAPLILAELLAGVGLLIKSWRSSAALLAVVLLAVFTIALAINQQLAPGVECGCWFTITLGKATASHIVQNLILLGLAFTIWLEERRTETSQISLEPSLERSSS
jgi:uncharacterized membrane protein